MRQTARSQPGGVAAPAPGSEKSRGWDRGATLSAIATFDDDTIAELFWLGHDMELANKKKHVSGIETNESSSGAHGL